MNTPLGPIESFERKVACEHGGGRRAGGGMSKYEYGNVGLSVCLCAGFLTDKWFLSTPVVRTNQSECQWSQWVAKIHTCP